MFNYGSCLSDRSACSVQSQKLKLVTYNMHGFSQGYSTVRDLISEVAPKVFFIQEHWLTPANMSKFQFMFCDYLTFGSSAMSSSVETGIFARSTIWRSRYND